jgi:hypothetical protein
MGRPSPFQAGAPGRAELPFAVELVEAGEVSGHRPPPPLLDLMQSAGAVTPTGAAAVGAAGALAGQPLGAVGPPDDRPGAVVGRHTWLSLYSSITTLAPRMAYRFSRRTHWYSSAGNRSRAMRVPGLSATNTGSNPGTAGWPSIALAGVGDGPLPDGLRVAARASQAVAGEGLRNDGQVVPAGWRRRSRCPPARPARRPAQLRPGRRGTGWAASPPGRGACQGLWSLSTHG